MVVKTFYWHESDKGEHPLRRFFPRLRGTSSLIYGNAGDLFNIDLLKFLYGNELRNIADGGHRILAVGSIIHRIADGDLVCGAGTKGAPIPSSEYLSVTFRGVRGPLTVDALREAGHDTSDVRFTLDPGLLARHIYPNVDLTIPTDDHRIFIPHYKDVKHFKSSKDITVITPDMPPELFVNEIAKATYVYSSSLHGIIFAHALGRPCTLTTPLTAEPEIKYRDYFASIGLPWRTPLSFYDSLRLPENEVIPVPNSMKDFDFPTFEELLSLDIAEK